MNMTLFRHASKFSADGWLYFSTDSDDKAFQIAHDSVDTGFCAIQKDVLGYWAEWNGTAWHPVQCPPVAKTLTTTEKQTLQKVLEIITMDLSIQLRLGHHLQVNAQEVNKLLSPLVDKIL